MLKKISFLACALALTFTVAVADEAVFSDSPVETISPAPISEIEPSLQGEVDAVENKGAASLSNEKFKSAVNSLESAQVDVREQLSVCKAKVDEKEIEVANKKNELSVLKKEYRTLQKKMKSIENIKKKLNDNIQ